jgi:hypothetical protein
MTAEVVSLHESQRRKDDMTIEDKQTKVRVLRDHLVSGEPVHRDLFLTEGESQDGDALMPCVWRAASGTSLVALWPTWHPHRLPDNAFRSPSPRIATVTR